ncbi:protein B4 [Anabas testudineus]|uniref:H15 domain-containing protein n=1 Tax=Anabas testudineus TaxID=64144 RepID=A0A7N6C0S9_ANATE|nr:protein B4 [Anabas testudineus]
MPPKKPAADSADPSSSDAPVEEKLEKKTDAATVRKIAAHPSTAIMVKEALKELDSRKGVSSQAIQSFIKQKYPSVDLVRLKHFVRRALKKGIENGTLVRPANSGVATGAMGKFRLAPKIKESKPKNENVDPNAQKAPKPVKEGAKKPKKAGATKKKDSTKEQTNSQEDSKPPKKSKKAEGAATTKAAPAKKPKAKLAAENEDGDGTADSTKPKGEGDAASKAPKTKVAKTTKEAKAGKASKSKAAKTGSDASASKATGKRGKKTAE